MTFKSNVYKSVNPLRRIMDNPMLTTLSPTELLGEKHLQRLIHSRGKIMSFGTNCTASLRTHLAESWTFNVTLITLLATELLGGRQNIQKGSMHFYQGAVTDVSMASSNKMERHRAW